MFELGVIFQGSLWKQKQKKCHVNLNRSPFQFHLHHSRPLYLYMDSFILVQYIMLSWELCVCKYNSGMWKLDYCIENYLFLKKWMLIALQLKKKKNVLTGFWKFLYFCA